MCCLRRHIQKNKGRLCSLEEELNSLHRSIQQTCGSRRQGITLLRRKIEVQNDKVLGARQRFFAARKARAVVSFRIYIAPWQSPCVQVQGLALALNLFAWPLQVLEAAEKKLQAEEAVKAELCRDLSELVAQSADQQLVPALALTKECMQATSMSCLSVCCKCRVAGCLLSTSVGVCQPLRMLLSVCSACATLQLALMHLAACLPSPAHKHHSIWLRAAATCSTATPAEWAPCCAVTPGGADAAADGAEQRHEPSR